MHVEKKIDDFAQKPVDSKRHLGSHAKLEMGILTSKRSKHEKLHFTNEA
jgi:hypothetical protein